MYDKRTLAQLIKFFNKFLLPNLPGSKLKSRLKIKEKEERIVEFGFKRENQAYYHPVRLSHTRHVEEVSQLAMAPASNAQESRSRDLDKLLLRPGNLVGPAFEPGPGVNPFPPFPPLSLSLYFFD